MPFMTEAEQEEIMKRAHFLLDKGFELTKKSKYGLDYYNGWVEFTIFYGRYDETSDISVRFDDKDDICPIGWFEFFANNKQTPTHSNKLEEILYLLDFIENNYELATNYEEHMKVDDLLDEYLDNLPSHEE